MNHAPSTLLAIVEVDEAEAVGCQAPACNHKVFRQVHVVRTDGEIRVLGSSCFKKLFAGSELIKTQPRLTTKGGRRLTDEERRLLQENAAALVQRFEEEFQARPPAASLAPPRRNQAKTRRSLFADPLAGVDPSVIAEAKRVIAQRHHCDADQPGWKGLVIAEVQEILRRNAA